MYTGSGGLERKFETLRAERKEGGRGGEKEKNSISHAQLVSGRNWPVNKVARQTRDADTSRMAKSHILSFVRSV